MSVRECSQTLGTGPPEDEGVVNVWEGDNVPGITRQRASFERWDIVDEMNNDHFHKFVRKGDG